MSTPGSRMRGRGTPLVFRGTACSPRACRSRGVVATSFANGVGQRLKVIGVHHRRRELTGVAHYFPAPRNGEAHSVFFAEVIGVRFGGGGQWANDGGGVRVHVRQRRDRTAATACAGTSASVLHRR